MKNKTMFELVKCNICNSDDFEVVINPDKRVKKVKILSASGGVRGTQTIVKCNKCGLVYVNPRIDGKTVVKAYEDGVDSLYISQADQRVETFSHAIKILDQYVPKKGKVLDVGAAAGFFMQAAKKDGWKVDGVEPSQQLTKWGSSKFGFRIRQGTLSANKLRAGTYDAVTMWDVLEHVPDPLTELIECKRVLKKGGIILINYPNYGSKLARLAGKYWWFLLSVHLYYFTPDTIAKTLKKAGFRLVHTQHHWQTLRLGYLFKMVGLYSKGLSRLGEKACRILGIYELPIPYYASQETVIAKKIK